MSDPIENGIYEWAQIQSKTPLPISDFVKSLNLSPRSDCASEYNEETGVFTYYINTDQQTVTDAYNAYDFSVAQAAQDARMIGLKIEALWTAANTYQTIRISGAALSLVSMGTHGATHGTPVPEAVAIFEWIQNLWGIYYARKAAITLNSAVDLDFSVAGEMPFTVPQLQAAVMAHLKELQTLNNVP